MQFSAGVEMRSVKVADRIIQEARGLVELLD